MSPRPPSDRSIRLLAVGLVVAIIAAIVGLDPEVRPAPHGSTRANSRRPPPQAAARRVVLSLAEGGKAIGFAESRAHARSGHITLRLSNPVSSPLRHGIAIHTARGTRAGPVVSPGRVSSVTVTLAPGRYQYYCPYGDHRALGMRGVLVVN